MSDAAIFTLVFAGLFVLRIIAATVVFFVILPRGDRCPNCDAVTLRIESRAWERIAPWLRNSWCAQGATVEFRSGPYEHMAGIFLGAPGGVQFLADRFAGKAPISNCTAGGGNRF